MPDKTGGAREEHIENMRKAIEHRATWFHLLWDEAGKKGHNWEDIARPAIFKCGCIHGEDIKARCENPESMVDFEKAFANPLVKEIFQMDVVKLTEDELEIHFNYCPLVKAWEKLGCTGDDLALLCDVAMDGDRGIISKFQAFDLDIGDTIAQGHPSCKLKFQRIKK